MLNSPNLILNLDQLLTSSIAPANTGMDVVQNFGINDVPVDVCRVVLHPGDLQHVLVGLKGTVAIHRAVSHVEAAATYIRMTDHMGVELVESVPRLLAIPVRGKELANDWCPGGNLLLCYFEEQRISLCELGDVPNLIHTAHCLHQWR